MFQTALDDPLFDTVQCAKAFGCTVQFLEKMRVTGRGPEFVRIGRLVRYRKSAIDAYLDRQKASSTSGIRRRSREVA